MFYQRWKEIAEARRGNCALRDLESGRTWTFAQLFADGETVSAKPGPIAFPQGQSAGFILALLAAWREEKVVCPLELNQARPSFGPLPGGCAHLKWTSGTSEASRAVAFTSGQLAADAGQIVRAMGLRPEWPNLGVISLAHSYGFSNLVLPLLLHGIPLILVPAPLPEIVRRAAAQEQSVTLAAVPALWRAWHEAGGLSQQIRLAISAGAPLPLALEQKIFSVHRIKIHNFYGASECGGIAYDDSPEPRCDASLAGAPMLNARLSLNAGGCLTVTGKAVGQTYLPEASETLGGGRFQSSDLAELKGGLVYLRGRAGDLINMAGRKVSPETIERELLAHPGVRECVVFGAPDKDAARTEMIVAVVASGESEAELKRFLLDKIPGWQLPRRWKFVEALPCGPRGKISRAECRARFKE